MTKVQIFSVYFSILFVLFSTYSAHSESISSLQKAEQKAIKDDSILQSLLHKKNAFSQQAEGVKYWKNPKLKMGLSNLPLDSFDIEQEPMTQLKVAISQQLPLGNSLTIRSSQLNSQSDEQSFKYQLRQREIKKKVRSIWVDLILEKKQLKLLRKNRQLLKEFRDLSELNYASGRGNQYAIFQADLKINLLDDQIENNKTRLYVAQEKLKRWIGNEINIYHIPNSFEIFTIEPDSALNRKEYLTQHPSLSIVKQQIQVARQQVELKQQAFKPQWGMELSYGKRFAGRSDFVSAFVNVNYPLWQKSKQHKSVASGELALDALSEQLINQQKKITSLFDVSIEKLKQIQKRQLNYKNQIILQARENTNVALSTYENGVGDFKDLLRARETQLTVQLSQIKLSYQYALEQINLLDLLGDKDRRYVENGEQK